MHKLDTDIRNFLNTAMTIFYLRELVVSSKEYILNRYYPTILAAYSCSVLTLVTSYHRA